MKQSNYWPLILSGIFYCSSFEVVADLSYFVIPEKIQTTLLFTSFLIGVVSCVVFNFYRVSSIKYIFMRMVVLHILSSLYIILFGVLGIKEILGKFVQLRDFFDENYASSFAIAAYIVVMLNACLLGIVVYLVINFCKRKKGDRSLS